MARPTVYKNPHTGERRVILQRVPYALVGEVVGVVPNSQAVAFPVVEGNSPFIHILDAPFELHDVIPRAYLTDAAGTPTADPVPNTNAFWGMTIRQNAFANAEIARVIGDGSLGSTSSVQLADLLIDQRTGLWNVSGPKGGDPQYFGLSEGWNVTVESFVVLGGPNLTIDLTLRGYILMLGDEVGAPGREPQNPRQRYSAI